MGLTGFVKLLGVIGNMLCCCNDTFIFQEKKTDVILYSMSETDYLTNIEYSDTIPFVFPIKYGKVIKVYDGDTITIAAKLPNTDGPIYRFSVRLDGIDTPEIRGKTEAEKELAKHVRDVLHEMIFGKIVELRNVSNEKYGRILADVYLGELNINQWLVSENLAVAYDGGKKQRPSSWD